MISCSSLSCNSEICTDSTKKVAIFCQHWQAHRQLGEGLARSTQRLLEQLESSVFGYLTLSGPFALAAGVSRSSIIVLTYSYN